MKIKLSGAAIKHCGSNRPSQPGPAQADSCPSALINEIQTNIFFYFVTCYQKNCCHEKKFLKVRNFGLFWNLKSCHYVIKSFFLSPISLSFEPEDAQISIIRTNPRIILGGWTKQNGKAKVNKVGRDLSTDSDRQRFESQPPRGEEINNFLKCARPS